jgi:hypothetical protein
VQTRLPQGLPGHMDVPEVQPREGGVLWNTRLHQYQDHSPPGEETPSMAVDRPAVQLMQNSDRLPASDVVPTRNPPALNNNFAATIFECFESFLLKNVIIYLFVLYICVLATFFFGASQRGAPQVHAAPAVPVPPLIQKPISIAGMSRRNAGN